MTIIEGDTGLILIDPLLSNETAEAALNLYLQNRPAKPVAAVIYSHSHADHFGGAKGVISADDAASGKVKIIAPDGFTEHAVAENVIAGNAMSRRAQYQFGSGLPVGERAQIDTGLGKALSNGTISLIPPNDLIKQSYETRNVDGVEVEFHLVPGSEAPSEMIMYFPRFKLLNMAEDVTHNMHNLYTLRGAEIRDGRLWSRYIDEAIARYGERADVIIAQHHWPMWGNARIVAMMKKQRDLYKFIHDQTVRLLNHGLTPTEIAEQLKLPPSLADEWSTRGYYGTLSHNAKAVYQFYLGWYDANPADLNPLPRVEEARKQVEYMGGPDAVLRRAREDFKAGQYRWVASVMSQLVFADPANTGGARSRCRCAGTTGLSERGRDLAQCLSARRGRIAGWRPTREIRIDGERRVAQGRLDRSCLRFSRRQAQRGEGRRQAHRNQLDLYRSQRDIRDESGEFGADAPSGQAFRRRGCRRYADPRRARRDYIEAAQLPRQPRYRRRLDIRQSAEAA
jgi:alkyl sulfatase BDS1-like metallo-beta-lactamase superfamily hydrolase